MISQSCIFVVKEHCQIIMDVIRMIENTPGKHRIDKSIVLIALSNYVSSFNKLGEFTQVLISELRVFESNEQQIEKPPPISNEVQNSSPPESNSSYYENALWDISDDTFHDLFQTTRFSSDKSAYKHDDIEGKHGKKKSRRSGQTVHDKSSCANTNNSNEVQELTESSSFMQGITSDNNDRNRHDLQTDPIEFDLDLDAEIGNNEFVIYESVTSINDESDLISVDSIEMNSNTGRKQKRKSETTPDFDGDVDDFQISKKNKFEKTVRFSEENQIQEIPNSNPRKTVTFSLPNVEDIGENEYHCQDYRNNDPNIYWLNQSKCLLCMYNANVGKITLANHYLSNHQKHEFFIARPSPQMADKLRLQTEKFTLNEKGKMVGLCYFCEEIKDMNKALWKDHILRHTGEKNYACTGI